MSDNELKMQKLLKINGLFDSFIENIKKTKNESTKGDEFLKGYSQCVLDLLKDVDSDSESDLMILLRAKMEIKIKNKVYSELLDGLSALHGSFDKTIGE